MTAATSGSTTPRPRDKGAGARRATYLQAILMQAMLGFLVLVLALFSLGEPRTAALYGATLIVPAGWGITFWTGYKRSEQVRRDGTWSREWEIAERKRTLSWMGGIVVMWVALAMLTFVVL